MSGFVLWIEKEFGVARADIDAEFTKAKANVSHLIDEHAGEIEVAMATTAMAEFPALTKELWTNIKVAFAKASAAVEKQVISGDLKWSTAMADGEAFLKSVGVTTFSQTTKDDLLQGAAAIVKAGLFAGLTAAGVPTPASSPTSAPSSPSKAP